MSIILPHPKLKGLDCIVRGQNETGTGTFWIYSILLFPDQVHWKARCSLNGKWDIPLGQHPHWAVIQALSVPSAPQKYKTLCKSPLLKDRCCCFRWLLEGLILFLSPRAMASSAEVMNPHSSGRITPHIPEIEIK